MSCLPRFSMRTRSYLNSLPDDEIDIHWDGSNLTKYDNLTRFTKLKYLYCPCSNTTTIPPLPDTIEILHLQCNSVWNIDKLPTSLTNLDISTNLISLLPQIPQKLEVFNCSYNNLTTIPPLPPTLETLECCYNHIHSLPAQSHTQLELLECSFNRIQKLPSLSHCLRQLYCSDNCLRKLPSLPNTLKRLDCSTNLITHLPTLPEKLYQLICNDNNLRYLPLLPESLDIVQFENNPMCEYFAPYNIPLLRKQVSILYKFRSTYYHLKFKQRFRNILWVMRDCKARIFYSPENLLQLLKDVDDEDNSQLLHILDKW